MGSLDTHMDNRPASTMDIRERTDTSMGRPVKPHIYMKNGHWTVRRTLDNQKQGRDTYDWVCAHLDLFPYIEYVGCKD